jgi:fibronectin type 3 domain-containing protein
MRPEVRRSALVLVLGAAVACGKIGPLRPPAPRGPQAPGEVEARQLGAGVEVAFTVPQPTGQGTSQQVARTQILRVDYPKGVTPAADPDAFRLRGQLVAEVSAENAPPGTRRVIADSTVQQISGGGLGWTLRYGVRVRDRRDRPSPLVVAHDLLVVETAAPPSSLTAQASADGVRLTWEAPAGTTGVTYNIYRGPADGLLSELPINLQPVTTVGYLDASAENGKTYRYVVRAVAVEGRPFHESMSSPNAIVDASDRFAPAAPAGLVAVQEGAAVRLLWNPGAEPDLDGYFVYRRSGEEWVRQGGLVGQPSYLDTAVKAGDVLRYRVTSVDRASPANESAPSNEVEVQVAAEPGTGG